APPPYTTRDFADYTGFSLDKVYELITEGILQAEYVKTPGKSRGTYRIHEDAFIACLQRLNWSRMPARRA
ncbi:MAG: helix-turn-helix domain-containing protein, partial [Vicinamibacterales bacterium]